MAILGDLERKNFSVAQPWWADIYSTTFDQENSSPFNSILKVLGIIPGYMWNFCNLFISRLPTFQLEGNIMTGALINMTNYLRKEKRNRNLIPRASHLSDAKLRNHTRYCIIACHFRLAVRM